MRALPLCLLLTVTSAACDTDDAGLAVAELYTVEGPGEVAPPGFGPAARLVLATRMPPGRVATFDLATGAPVDPPFDALSTPTAPVTEGSRIALVTALGRVALYEPTGDRVALVPTAPLGPTSPLVVAPEGTLWVASTSGQVIGLDRDGSTTVDLRVEGVPVGAPAIAPDGSVFVATDVGRIHGFGTDGDERFRITRAPPVSPPVALPSGGVAVIAEDRVQAFDGSGAELYAAAADGATGLVAGPGGVVLAWSPDGRLRRLDPDGTVAYAVELVPGGADIAPVALPDARAGWVGRDGIARTLAPDGSTAAERALPGSPTGAILRGDDGVAWVPLGREVVAIDFTLAL